MGLKFYTSFSTALVVKKPKGSCSNSCKVQHEWLNALQGNSGTNNRINTVTPSPKPITTFKIIEEWQLTRAHF